MEQIVKVDICKDLMHDKPLNELETFRATFIRNLEDCHRLAASNEIVTGG